MLTRLRIRNFKRFDNVDIELGNAVVLIGANNSGKTTALQALALWNVGLRRWNEKRGGKDSPEKRPGVTINRRDLAQVPVPAANLLWRDTAVRKGRRVDGRQKTLNVRVDVIVDGIDAGSPWSCGLEFDYSNEESFVCRPIRLSGYDDHPVQQVKFDEIPAEAANVRIAYLPPMSGLAAVEPVWEPGRINVLIGEGQTAQVLRNLCHQIHAPTGSPGAWEKLVEHISRLFGVTLEPPDYIAERGEITMAYREGHGPRLDLSSSGRGLQQTLLLLAHLYTNPNTVLLLDEPDAHLETRRQREIYQLLTEVAQTQSSQIIAASHSEVVLDEAAGRDTVISFVGRPHRLNDRGSQLIKALTSIGWDQYFQAEETGWVLYLEDATDLAILQAFARTLGHEAGRALDRPFVHYVATNLPQRARDHFFGLREGKSDLLGIALFDHLDKELHRDSPLIEMMWQRREIENYLCTEKVLLAYARAEHPDDLFALSQGDRRVRAMRESIEDLSKALQTLDQPDPWSNDIKASSEFLEPLFKAFFAKLGLPLTLRKSSYHELAALVPKALIDGEVVEKLDDILAVAKRAASRQETTSPPET